jgi:hypothetical protein
MEDTDKAKINWVRERILNACEGLSPRDQGMWLLSLDHYLTIVGRDFIDADAEMAHTNLLVLNELNHQIYGTAMRLLDDEEVWPPEAYSAVLAEKAGRTSVMLGRLAYAVANIEKRKELGEA